MRTFCVSGMHPRDFPSIIISLMRFFFLITFYSLFCILVVKSVNVRLNPSPFLSSTPELTFYSFCFSPAFCLFSSTIKPTDFYFFSTIISPSFYWRSIPVSPRPAVVPAAAEADVLPGGPAASSVRLGISLWVELL